MRWVCIFAFCLPVGAAVTSTVTCNPGLNQPSQTITINVQGPANCNESIGSTASAASASSSLTSSNNSFSVSASASGSAHGVNLTGSDSGSFASASTQTSFEIVTSGSARPGFVTVAANSSIFAADVATGLAFWSLSGVLSQSTAQGFISAQHTFAVTLGDFLFTSTLNGAANNSGEAQSPNFMGSIQVQFQFFEADGTTPVAFSVVNVPAALIFVPVTPCRVVDTRNPNGPFGGPALAAGETRAYAIPNGACGIPSSALAYSLNATVVPSSTLGYLTLWPSDQPQPNVSTLNSLDGRVKASAAIVPAASNGSASINVYVTDSTQLILDINGYFQLPAGNPGYLFYPVQPCRIWDTRQPGDGPLSANLTRSFPVAGSCGVPAYGGSGSAIAYSLNITAIPRQAQLGYLTMWQAGGSVPLVSTLNAPTGAITANAAIVPAGLGGAISALASDDADLVIDVNGYFAADSPSVPTGLYFFPIAPSRVLDTRSSSGVFSGTLPVNVLASDDAISPGAQAYVLNATVVPAGSLEWLSLWPDGAPMPLASTLNAYDGAITSNMAIVPSATNGAIDAFASAPTDLVIDVFGYFR